VDVPWEPQRARRFIIAMSTVNRMLPRRAREWPRDHLLRGLG